MKQNTKKLRPDTLAKMLKAKRLILREGLTQKAAANKIAVTEKTISKWIKDYGWKADMEKAIYEMRSANSLQDFTVFVHDKYPEDYARLQEMYNAYIIIF